MTPWLEATGTRCARRARSQEIRARTRQPVKAAVHDGTPAVAHFDSMGRAVYSVAHNRLVDPTTSAIVEEFLESHVVVDLESNMLASVDARGNSVATYEYDRAGYRAHVMMLDAGERWTLSDCTGKPFYAWDVKNGQSVVSHTTYDALNRPLQLWVREGGGPEKRVEETSYGEGQAGDKAQNLRGRPYQRRDRRA